MSHLVNFKGTDTILANSFTNEYYNNEEYRMYGFSVPASEHSIATSFGRDREEEYFMNMLENYPTGIVSIVSDSYNIYNFVEKMSIKYKDKILQRDGAVVFRPDSGEPVEVNMKLIDILWRIFGGTYNEKGYKLLPPQVRLIQGDGIDIDMIENILSSAKSNKYSADNWVFGSGGGLLQKFDRDTQKFAIKASYGERINEKGEIESFDIQKDPIGSSSKKSKAGKLKLHPTSSGFMTFSTKDINLTQFNAYADCLETVFENGEIKRFQTFEEIREISNSYI